MNELEMARAETITELSDEFIKSMKKILLSHGPDPQLISILVAAYAMSIKEVEKQSPGFTHFMAKMLEDQDAS